MRDLNQSIIKFDYDKNFKNEDFYLSKSNKHVFNFLDMWPKWEKNFVNVIGERLSGKSHLMNIFLQKNKGIKFEGKFLGNDDLKKSKIYENIIIENLTSEKKFRLEQGGIIIYPRTYLHSVKEVLNGERIVCVGWIESYIKSIEEREYLFDLDAGARSLLAKHGRSDELDLIFKSYSNLLRIMGD